jgi:hypothetical protein
MFLRIENKVSHIPDIDILCTLGESTSRGNNETIGQFGTGFIFTLADFAREGILEQCKICFGLDVYTPYLESSKAYDSAGNIREIKKIGLKKQNGGKFPLNVSIGFGEMDWHGVGMGVRELFSNAIDGAITFDGTLNSFKYERVHDNQCNAKKGTIRVYIPLTDEVIDYMEEIEQNFICIKSGYDQNARVISKSIPSPCSIYRKGVRVYQSSMNSLFDYNIPDIEINEARKIDPSQARTAAAKALMLHSRDNQMDKFFRETLFQKVGDKVWEDGINHWDINPHYFNSDNCANAITRMGNALTRILGGNVLSQNPLQNIMLANKGLTGVIPKSDDIYNIFSLCQHIKKAKDILSDAEALGNTVIPPTQRVLNVRDNIWKKLVKRNLTNGRDLPLVHCFNSAVSSGGQTFGYVSPDYSQIYIHEDISEDNGVKLYDTMLEEIGHYVTKSEDFTRDLQSFFINLSARLMMEDE